MHSFSVYVKNSNDVDSRLKQFIIHHNGDFSGKVIIKEISLGGESIIQHSIPFEVLMTIVSKAVVNKKISELEQKTPKEILGL